MSRLENKLISMSVYIAPSMFFIYCAYEVYVSGIKFGFNRYFDIYCLFVLMVCFYIVMIGGVIGPKIVMGKAERINYVTIIGLVILVSLSGVAIGRMYSYMLNNVYKVDGEKNLYVLKLYSDRLVFAECQPSKVLYSLESDVSKYKLLKLSDAKEKQKLRGCLFSGNKTGNS